MYTLESLNLIGNPIVNQHPKLARIDNDENAVQEALNSYFLAAGGFGATGGISTANLHATGGTASQSQRVTGTMGLQNMDTFKSNNNTGFLARAEAARADY